MKSLTFFLTFIFAAPLLFANEWIINPSYVVSHSASEPLFYAAYDDAKKGSRELASVSVQERDKHEAFNRHPTQYLDILKKIPHSEARLQKVWAEQRSLSSESE